MMDSLSSTAGAVFSRENQAAQVATPDWDDCKVAFGIDYSEAFGTWMETTQDGRGLLPKGWSLCETDASGARYVVVFRVEGLPTVADGKTVRTLLDAITKEPA